MGRLPRSKPRVAWTAKRGGALPPAVTGGVVFDVATGALGGLPGIRGLDARSGDVRFVVAIEPWCAPVVIGDGLIAIGGRSERGREVVRIRADGTIAGRDPLWMNQGEDALTHSRYALGTTAMEENALEAELRPLGARERGYLVRLGTVFQIRGEDGATLREEAFLRSRILAAGEGAVLAQCWRSQPQKTMLELFAPDRRQWRSEKTYLPPPGSVVLSRPRRPAGAAWITGGALIELDDEAQQSWIRSGVPGETIDFFDDDPEPAGDDGSMALPNVPPDMGTRPARPPAELWMHSIESGAVLQRASIDGEVTSVAATPHVVAVFTAGADAGIHRWTPAGEPLARMPLGARSAGRSRCPAFACADDVHLLWASGETLVCSLLASPGETAWQLESPFHFRGPAPRIDVGLSFVHAAADDGVLVLTGERELCTFVDDG